MSCFDVMLSLVSEEPNVSATDISEYTTVSISMEDAAVNNVYAYSVDPEIEIAIASAQSPQFAVSKDEINVEFAVTKICTLAEFISCIGNGLWIDEQPWLNIEGWKN